MEYKDEQKENILRHYDSIEDYEKKEAIKEAQEYLNKTDYIVIKLYEYNLTGEEIDKDYNSVFVKREKMRNILRELEGK